MNQVLRTLMTTLKRGGLKPSSGTFYLALVIGLVICLGVLAINQAKEWLKPMLAPSSTPIPQNVIRFEAVQKQKQMKQKGEKNYETN